MRMFGITKAGNSVCAHVHGFHPYLFIEAPPNFKPAGMAWPILFLFFMDIEHKIIGLKDRGDEKYVDENMSEHGMFWIFEKIMCSILVSTYKNLGQPKGTSNKGIQYSIPFKLEPGCLCSRCNTIT